MSTIAAAAAAWRAPDPQGSAHAADNRPTGLRSASQSRRQELYLEAAPGLRLDPISLLFSISVLAFLLAAVSFSTASASPSQRGALHEWGKAMLCAGAGFMLYFLRGHAPWLLTYVVSNTLVLGGGVFGLRAHARLFEDAIPQRLVSLLAAFGLAGLFGVYALDGPRQLSAFTLSIAIGALLGMISFTTLRTAARRRSPMAWVSALTAGAAALMLAARAANSVRGSVESVSVGAATVQQVSVLVLAALFVLGTSMGFISLVHERQRRETLERARRDGLTGLYTRSAFFELAQQIDRAGRERYAAVMVDIDHFKAINDTFGHLGGDITLAHAARLINNSIRLSDVAGRYGGEEFSIILRGCGEAEAAAFAERLVNEASRQSVRLDDGRRSSFTLSVGYACRALSNDGHGESASEVLGRADRALYEAKRSGRNRAISAGGAPLLAGA
jgi:diguanylate cyclase (GGDEF)-like protein